MSMKPGATTWPRASMMRRAGRAERGSTATMRPALTLTSASRTGAPVPSISCPPRISRSSMPALVHHHAALDLALEQRVVSEVHVGQRHAARDQLLQLVLAAHEHVDEHRHVGALVAGTERRAREHALLQEERRVE